MNTRYTLELSNDDLLVINEGLMLVQYGKAAPVISRINDQLIQKKELTEQEKLNNMMSFNK